MRERVTPMTQPLQTRRVKEALARIRSLFVIPGARLTTAHAARMAGLDRQVCRGLLQSLVEAGFLEHHLQGAFVRSPSASTTNRSEACQACQSCQAKDIA